MSERMIQPNPDVPCQWCGTTEHKEPIRCVEGQTCSHCGGTHWGSLYCPYSVTQANPEPAKEAQGAQNTDREIWRGKSRAEWGDPDRYYADSWHALAHAGQPAPSLLDAIEKLPRYPYHTWNRTGDHGQQLVGLEDVLAALGHSPNTVKEQHRVT